MKTLYCQGCSTKVMEIMEGSKIKKGAVVLCSNCEIKRKASDLAKKTSKNEFGDIFGGIFK